MWAFNCWWKLNKEKIVFDQPYKCVALYLSYIRGKKVNDWVDARQSEMDTNVLLGYGEEMEVYWNTFKSSFVITYSNLGEKMVVEEKLQDLKMEKQDIDTYITTFKNLLGQAEYTTTKQESLKMFKKGLPGMLNICIINNSNPVPDTLEEWIKAAQTQHLKWLQTQEFMKKPLTPKQVAFIKKFTTYQGFCWNKDPNTMDVDAGVIP